MIADARDHRAATKLGESLFRLYLDWCQTQGLTPDHLAVVDPQDAISCRICGKLISRSRSYDAAPVSNGRCCRHCKYVVVTPARLAGNTLSQGTTRDTTRR